MTSFYRLVISGGHTGSADCYLSGVAATIEELLAYVADDEMLSAFVLCDARVVALEVYRDGARRDVVDLRPLIVFTAADGRQLRPAEDLDPAEVVDVVADAAIGLSNNAPNFPAYPPLAAGRVRLANGAEQAVGWTGDFFDGGGARAILGMP